VRHLLALAFGLPHAAIRVHVPHVGGGFGGKAGLGLEPLAYVLSKACGGRPVQISMTREEEFNTTPSRQGLYSTIRLGASRDGRLTALEATYVWDAGAYADYGVNVGRAAAYSGAGPYALDHCSVDSYVVYTNKVYGTAYRGFGHLEVLWGVERAMDQMARKLGLDPVEFRRKNLLKEGDTTITGEAFTAGHGKPIECLNAAAKAIDWGLPSVAPSAPRRVRGKGVAMLHKAPAMPTYTSCAAIIKLDEDGAADVLVSGVDYGQGTYTVLRQIAAEELGLPIGKVHVTWECDTAMTPYDWQTVASRFAYMGGNAVIQAAADCLNQMRAVASQVLEISPGDLVCRDEEIYPLNEPERAVAYRDLALGYTFPNGNSIGGPIIGHGRYIATGLTNLDPETGQGRPAQFWTYGAHGVEIEVDTETGEIEVLKIATALDAGKVLNPLLCRGQVVGGIVQGLGSALHEGFRFDERGRLQNPSFVDYKIPTAKDLPREIVPILLENPQPDGPYGARGVAEHPMISVPSAIGNALSNALGIEFTSLPLSPERVLEKILEAERGP
jgi:CO/xanthine dehydrogenase Mo-binding subunit